MAVNNPRIYWYPSGAPTFSTITLPRLTDLEVEDMRDCSDTIALGGSVQRMDRGGWRRITIRLERLSGSDATQLALVRSFMSLSAHLRAGGKIAFSRDHDTAWGAYANTIVESGDTQIRTGNNTFPFNASAALASAEEITIESPNPSHLREFTTVTVISGGLITVPAVLQTFDGPTFVRQRDFYPVLYMSAEDARSQQIVTSEGRRLYSIELPLVEMPGEIAALAATAPLLGASGDVLGNGIGLTTLNGALVLGSARGSSSGGLPVTLDTGWSVNPLFTSRGWTR